MHTYFADTWYFVAQLDRRDSHHQNAVGLRERYRPAEVVTHDGVLTELLAYFAARGKAVRTEVVNFVREVVVRAEVVPVTRSLFIAGLNLYADRPDKGYSLTDCMSMVIMRERGINHVLTNDHHFRQEGFTVVGE